MANRGISLTFRLLTTRWAGVCLLFLVTGGMVTPVAGQPAANAPTLSSSLINASSTLSDADFDQVNRFVDHHVQQLLSGSDAMVAQSRRALAGPLRDPNAGSAFMPTYLNALAEQLAPALQSDRVMTRLNAILIAQALRNPRAAPLLRRGLRDASPAVRYIAAKAVRESDPEAADSWPRDATLTDTQKDELLEALGVAVLTERENTVNEQLLLAMVALDTPSANVATMQAIEARIILHQADPDLPVTALIDAHSRLYTRYIRRTERGAAIDAAQIRQLTQVSCKLMLFAVNALNAGVVGDVQTPQYRRLIQVADFALRFTVGSYLDANAAMPAEINQPLLIGDWDQIKLVAEEWVVLLSRPPIEISQVQLRP